MPQGTEAYSYSDEILYGRTAYGYGNAVPEVPELDEEQAQSEQQRKALEKRKAANQTAYHLSVMSIAGYVVAAVLAVTVLLAYASYTRAADSVVELQTRLEELTETEKKLKIQYEEAFDITEIEKYAVGNLGMSKPTSEQIASADATTGNKSEIITEEKEEIGVFSQISRFVTNLFGNL